MAALREKLATTEMQLYTARGETAILRSNLDKSSQSYATQLRDVQDTQSAVRHEHEQELEQMKRELEILRNEHRFARNDLAVLRQENSSLERKLKDFGGRSTQGPAASQSSATHEVKNSPRNVFPSRGTPPRRVETNKNLMVSLKESYMDGFSVALPSPSKKRPAASTIPLTFSPKKHKPKLLAFGSSNAPTTSSPSELADELLDEPANEPFTEDIEAELNSLRSDAQKASANASRTQRLLNFIDSVLSFSVVGLGESFKFLERYEIHLDLDVQSVASYLRESLLLEDPDSSTPEAVVQRFVNMCVRILEHYADQMTDLIIVPVVLQLMAEAVIVDTKIIVEETGALKMLNNLIVKMLDGLNGTDPLNTEVTLETGHKVYALLYAIDVLEYIACAAANLHLQKFVWEAIKHTTLIKLLDSGTPITVITSTIDLLVTSITTGSVGFCDDDHEVKLLSAISSMLTDPLPTSVFELFVGLNPLTDFNYRPFFCFPVAFDTKLTLTNPTFSTSKHYSHLQITQLHTTHTVLLRRAIIHLFLHMLIRHKDSMRAPILEGVITCLSNELDYALNCVNPSSESVLLVDDCVSFLHALLTISPDVLDQVRNLGGRTPHEYMVSLSRIFFNDPPSANGNDDMMDYELTEADGLEQLGEIGVVFGSNVTQKVWELLEKYVSPEEAGDLFASMSVSQNQDSQNQDLNSDQCLE